MVPACAGSSPVGPPNMSTFPRGLRRQIATLLFAGSNPAVLSKYGKVAPMVERRIEDPGGAGSSPALTTNMVK